jgi:hypothetical protein
MPLVNERDLPPVEPLDGAGGLGWPQVAAVTEVGDQVEETGNIRRLIKSRIWCRGIAESASSIEGYENTCDAKICSQWMLQFCDKSSCRLQKSF